MLTDQPEHIPVTATKDPPSEPSEEKTRRRLMHSMAAKSPGRPRWDLPKSAAWGDSPIDIYVKRNLASSDAPAQLIG
jgi:hypothetical protein